MILQAHSSCILDDDKQYLSIKLAIMASTRNGTQTFYALMFLFVKLYILLYNY